MQYCILHGPLKSLSLFKTVFLSQHSNINVVNPVSLHSPGQQLVDLPVVVVVVPDAEEALHVPLHRPAEQGRVHGAEAADRHVGKVADASGTQGRLVGFFSKISWSP